MHDSDMNTETRVTGIEDSVAENTAESAGVNATEVRVLTIPGAVYRSSSEHTLPIGNAASSAPVTYTPTVSYDAPTYTEALSDTYSDGVYTNVSVDEPLSKTSNPAASDVAEDEVHIADADYDRADAADDAGHYTVHTEHEPDEPVSSEPHPIGVPYDPSHEENEYERFLAEQQEKAEKSVAKKRVALEKDVCELYLPVESIEKNVRLVEARMRCEIESMKAQHKMLGYTFSQDVLKRERTERRLRRQINDRMYRLTRALKRERSDNTRYYTAALDKYPGDPDKRASNTATIETILGRLDYLIKERDRLSDRLIALYEQATPNSKAGREAKVAQRAARIAYKSQLKAAKRLARMHAPAELKDRIYTLMNERITTLSTIEKNVYLISKNRYTGADKRAVKRQNKDMKRAARKMEDEIRDLMKRAEKHDQTHGAGMRQLAWAIGTLVILGALGVLYFLGKFYWGWF